MPKWTRADVLLIAFYLAPALVVTILGYLFGPVWLVSTDACPAVNVTCGHPPLILFVVGVVMLVWARIGPKVFAMVMLILCILYGELSSPNVEFED